MKTTTVTCDCCGNKIDGNDGISGQYKMLAVPTTNQMPIDIFVKLECSRDICTHCIETALEESPIRRVRG